MKASNTPEIARQSALAELATLTSIEFGTISEFHRVKPASDVNSDTPRGPYYKHQCWENGKNRSTYIPAEQIESLRQDIKNGKRFNQITSELAAAAIQQSRARRTAPTVALEIAEKKTSKPNVSPKNTEKRNTSSPKRAKNSPARKKEKP